MSETVDVKIFCTERVKYSVRKKIPKEVWDAYQVLLSRDADDYEFQEIAERVIDPLMDDPEGDGIEDLDIVLVKPSEE